MGRWGRGRGGAGGGAGGGARAPAGGSSGSSSGGEGSGGEAPGAGAGAPAPPGGGGRASGSESGSASESDSPGYESGSESESESGSLAPGRGAGAFGPSTWAEVDEGSIDRLAAELDVLARAASSAGRELPGAAWKPALAQGLGGGLLLEPAADPLGLGEIDHRTLTLVSPGGAAAGHPSHHRLSRAPGMLGRAGGGRASWMNPGPGGRSSLFGGDALAAADAGGASAAAAPAADSGGTPTAGGALAGDELGQGDLNALRPQVNLGGRDFCPEAYLAQVHRGTSRRELQQGLSNLEEALSERTGQLRDLVKENFDRFISCKNTIDDIQHRLPGEGSSTPRGGEGRRLCSPPPPPPPPPLPPPPPRPPPRAGAWRPC